jgi:hypothetical protein
MEGTLMDFQLHKGRLKVTWRREWGEMVNVGDAQNGILSFNFYTKNLSK